MNPADERVPTREVRDPWNRGTPILLDGFTERHRFEPWFAALIVLVLCWLLFQAVIAPVAIFALLAVTGVDLLGLLEELQTSGMGALDQYTAHLLGANTIGLVFAFGIPALILARMSSTSPLAFLRMRTSDVGLVLLGLVAWAFLVPVVQLTAQLNAALPWPAEVRTWEEQMLEPITRFLEQPGSLVPSLLMIAVAPAICEELLFRGYIQRQLERSMGASWSIALSGILFGAYHLQPTKVVPLALLGVFFAYLTWRSAASSRRWLRISHRMQVRSFSAAMRRLRRGANSPTSMPCRCPGTLEYWQSLSSVGLFTF